MGKKQKDRQKAVMKKRQKRNQSRKIVKKKMTASEMTFGKKMILESASLPLHECIINPDWNDSKMARIAITRKQNNGLLILGSFLVDLGCLGLKNTFIRPDFPFSDYQKKYIDSLYHDAPPIHCSLDLAHSIIYGAIEYADELGFKPNKDYALSKFILLPEKEFERVPLEFGKDGKPFYISGPNDNPEKIIRQLEKKVGPDNFHFLAGNSFF